MADYDAILKEIRAGVERSTAQNSRIINKLNKSAQRDERLLKALDEVAGEVEAGSPIRKKLNKIIADIKAHDTREDADA